MRMKAAFTPFTLDESSAMHIQSVKCKFALTNQRLFYQVIYPMDHNLLHYNTLRVLVKVYKHEAPH
jgi:hypothetical protein